MLTKPPRSRRRFGMIHPDALVILSLFFCLSLSLSCARSRSRSRTLARVGKGAVHRAGIVRAEIVHVDG